MKFRTLGRSGLQVSSVGMGVLNLSFGTGKAVDEAVGIRVLHAALNNGINFFDTAQAYGPYTNEILLGKALESHRHGVVVATKFGSKLESGTIAGTDSRPATIRAVAEASMKSLRTDYIYLFHQHRVDPSVPIEEVAGTLKHLIDEGKVRYYGLSEVGAATILRAHAVHPVAVVQNQYSITIAQFRT